MLVPILVYEFGPKEVVPIMAVAAIMANVARIMAWWREIDWRACAAYSITGVPAAALGARTLLILPSLMAGAFVAKRFVLRLDPRVFRLVMDGLMLLAALAMLWNAAQWYPAVDRSNPLSQCVYES
jgi:uncharacterized membrane protein YfcA